MTELVTSNTGYNIRCGTGEWEVAGPVSEYAPQIIRVHGVGGGVSIPGDELGLLIDALTTIRDHMKEGTR